MLMWTVDLGSAALLTALEVTALAAFWFAEGLKQWAAGGARPPGATARLFLVLTVGPTGLVAVSYGFYRADLPVACGSQALLAAPLSCCRPWGEERSAPAGLPSTSQGVVRSVSAFAGEGERRGGTASDVPRSVGDEGRSDSRTYRHRCMPPDRRRRGARRHCSPQMIGAPTLAYDPAGAACCTTSKDHSVDPLAAGFGRSPPP